jgi:hypothetical protein
MSIDCFLNHPTEQPDTHDQQENRQPKSFHFFAWKCKISFPFPSEKEYWPNWILLLLSISTPAQFSSFTFQSFA